MSPVSQPAPQVSRRGIIINSEELEELPVTGDEWDAVVAAADNDTSEPEVAGDKDEVKDVQLLAKALCVMRQPAHVDFADYLDDIQAALTYVMTDEGSGVTNGLIPGTENEPALALARNVTPLVLAADIINLRVLNPTLHADFVAWLSGPVRTTVLKGRTLISTHEDRPNNFGTHAGAARMAIARYIGDTADLAAAAAIYKGWTGDRNFYAGFNYGSLVWQADEDNPVGINPAGATKLDNAAVEQDVDGVLPEEMRRCDAGGPEGFTWPPCKSNYCYEALQGAVLQAIILRRCSRADWGGMHFTPFEWGDEAIRRALEWLDDPDRGNNPLDDAENGTDDYWIGYVANKVYVGLALPEAVGTPGKAFGFASWLALGEDWP